MKCPFWNGPLLRDMRFFLGVYQRWALTRGHLLLQLPRGQRLRVDTSLSKPSAMMISLQGKSGHRWLDRSFGGGACKSMGLGTCCYAETWTIIYEYLHPTHSNSLPQYAILLLCMLSSCAEFQGGTFVLRLHQIASQLCGCKGPRVPELANPNFCTKIETGLGWLRFYSIHKFLEPLQAKFLFLCDYFDLLFISDTVYWEIASLVLFWDILRFCASDCQKYHGPIMESDDPLDWCVEKSWA